MTDFEQHLIMIWKINVREYQRGNDKWTIQRNWKHRRRKTKQKHNAKWVGDHYGQTTTSNVNKTNNITLKYCSKFIFVIFSTLMLDNIESNVITKSVSYIPLYFTLFLYYLMF